MIVIMRHGKPKIDLNSLKQWMSSRYLGCLVNTYETVGLDADNCPPDDAIDISRQCSVFFSSDLPRAIDSVKLLPTNSQPCIDPCFRESSFPYLNLQRPYLPFRAWALLYRVAWLFGFAKNGESITAAKQRAKTATDKLINTAKTDSNTLVMGHGILNRLIDRELKNQGWLKKYHSGNGYWSYQVFEKSRVK